MLDRGVKNISGGMVAHRGEMVVTTYFHDDLVLVLLEYLEVHLVGVREPHGVAVVASTAIHVLDNDKLAAFFGKSKLILQPEHLLNS